MHCFPPQAREERKSSLRSIASLADVDDEPLFCFETALKTCYWCVMVYQRKAHGSRLQTHYFIYSPKRQQSPVHAVCRSILVYRYQEVHCAPSSWHSAACCPCSQSCACVLCACAADYVHGVAGEGRAGCQHRDSHAAVPTRTLRAGMQLNSVSG